MPSPILELQNITKYYFDNHALHNVSLDLFPGEIHTILGYNGAGKSTLAGILYGWIRPDGGAILLDGRPVQLTEPNDSIKHGIILCSQELNLFDDLSLIDNLFIRDKRILHTKEKQKKGREILASLKMDIPLNEIAGHLSGSEKALLQLGRSLAMDPKILILDEIYSSLTSAESKIVNSLLLQLKERGVAILIVTHRSTEIKQITDRITVMRDGEVVAQSFSENLNELQLIKWMLGDSIKNPYPRIPSATDDKLLSISNISNQFIKNINFNLHKGEIIGIMGTSGSGRSHILRAIAGVDRISDGEVVYAEKRVINNAKTKNRCKNIGYMPEDRDVQAIFPNLSIEKNVSIQNLSRITHNSRLLYNHVFDLEKEVLVSNDILERLATKTKNPKGKIIHLSSGNKQKVIFARCMFSKSSVYLLDEPTQGVDIAGKVEIYNIMNELTQKGAGIIIVSTDFSELVGMCDRIIIIKDGAMIADVSSNELDSLKVFDYIQK